MGLSSMMRLATAVVLLTDMVKGKSKLAPPPAQDCIACGSVNIQWKDADHCMRFEELPKIISSSNFEGRHGHASVVFPYNDRLALWVVGGRGIAYEKWNFQVTHRRADVWVYVVEERRWLKMDTLEGDFFARTDEAFLMEDVLDPGDVAPFWERFGHSLDVFPAKNVSDGQVVGRLNAMVLLGGFTPRPDNDVWVSKNGIAWYRVGYAPWTGRGYHAPAGAARRVIQLQLRRECPRSTSRETRTCFCRLERRSLVQN